MSGAGTAAQAPERRLALAVQDLGEGFALLDADTRILHASRWWLEVHGRFTGDGSQDGGTLSDWLAAGTQSGLRQRVLEHYRAHLKRCDGAWTDLRWGDEQVLESRFQSLPDGGVLAQLRDVTVARARTAELQASEDRFRAYAESSGDWLWELDQDLRCTHAAASPRESRRLDPERLLGSAFLERVRKLAVDPAELEPVARSLQAREPFRELEVRLRDADGDGDEHVISLSGAPFTGDDGSFRGFRGTGRNVTEARKLASRLAYQANHDDLTGLANRRALENRIGALLARRQGEEARHALCFLDVDQIKIVNDTCGHGAGDALLSRIGRRLAEGLRGADKIARLGGDEFGVLLRDVNPEKAVEYAQRIRTGIQKRPFTWEGQQFRVTVSIGVAPLSPDMDTAADVMRAADSACYAAKEGGRNRVKLYALDDSTLNLRQGEMHWVARIHSALAENRLELFLQPIAPTRGDDDRYLHYEALVRMTGRDGRRFLPGAFLPAAERYNLASQIDSWVLDEAIAWLDRSPLFLDHLHLLSVNLSGQSLGEPAFRSHVRERVRRHKLIGRKLCFEITETSAISNLEPVQEFMQSMREFGCSFALDDFGAGLSSFAYLQTLDVDYLKIDGMFVKDLTEDPVHRAMVKSINEVGHVMGKKTIAEFVDGEEVRGALAEIGVDMVQGYGIGKPVPFAEVV